MNIPLLITVVIIRNLNVMKYGWMIFSVLIACGCQTVQSSNAKMPLKCEGINPGVCDYTILLNSMKDSETTLGAEEQRKLETLAQGLKSAHNIRIAAEGHVFSLRDQEKELSWSMKLAEAAKQTLEKNGISSAIDVIGMGAEKPAFEPGTKKENLRIVIEVDDLDACPSDVLSECHSRK